MGPTGDGVTVGVTRAGQRPLARVVAGSVSLALGTLTRSGPRGVAAVRLGASWFWSTSSRNLITSSMVGRSAGRLASKELTSGWIATGAVPTSSGIPESTASAG